MDYANNKQPKSIPEGCTFDLIDHLDDWLEYLTKVLELSKKVTDKLALSTSDKSST